ncbi:MAG: PepSY domain-containing protein [Frateuria sp.]|uniref:PepSY domain-containing protein n=1 Tax=Frateuria sp. TaxID=2211372 RepID=UPI001828C5B0|nr:PepSY domain-containing protein [Frateuria sp.]NUO73843.1 PepSY domain-containing protein [Frateuria sp.]NUR23163.1 PepSY domain-containing protein [Frateuria sp.]
MRKLASITLALALGASGAVLAQQAMTEAQVRETLIHQGYTKIDDVKFDDGLWHAKARSADGSHVKLRIDPKSGEVYPDKEVSRLSEDDVRAALATQGYTHVHDVDFDDGVWKAKARDKNDHRVKVTVDPTSGRVIDNGG